MTLLDECCHEWAARALCFAREQRRTKPYGYTQRFWWPTYNNGAIRVLANRIIRTRKAAAERSEVPCDNSRE